MGMRRLFGCDERAPEPWYIDCPLCVGGCEECNEGELYFYRCPSHEMTGEEFKIIGTWNLLREHGTWPVAGGLDDQANWFVEAVQFLNQEAAAYKAREMERMKRG